MRFFSIIRLAGITDHDPKTLLSVFRFPDAAFQSGKSPTGSCETGQYGKG